MDQSPNPVTLDDQEKRRIVAPVQEQHVSFQNPPHHHYEADKAPFSPTSEDYEDEEEDVDEEEEERAFKQRLLDIEQRNQQASKQVSGSQQQQHHSPDSMDSNDFVKLEKPQDLFTAHHPEVNVELSNNKDEEITPSDDVAQPLTQEDLRDFAPSPQDAAHDLADRRAHQTLEQFLASTGETKERSEKDMSSYMHHHGGETTASAHRVAFDDEDEETFRRHGPLTLGQPATEAKSLHRDNHGLLDDEDGTPTSAHQFKTKAEDAAEAVGEFASKITHNAKEGAFKAKEVMEHGASQAKVSFGHGATSAKEAVEDLLGFEETSEGDSPRASPARNFSTDQQPEPETPIILQSVRPPTPPKPREADAPETPPILDLGGPGHPHHHHPPTSYQRKPSLKMTPNFGGATATGVIPIGNISGTKGPSWFDIRRWDRNVLDLIYWRDVKKSGIVFGVTLALLICLAVFNIITVVSYLGLLAMIAALGYRAYAGVMATVQKSEHKNPFQPYLEQSLDLPQDCVHEQVDVVLKHSNDLLHQLKRLFFVEDIFETLKFALMLWALTYVGAYFSGTALVILAFVGLFTLPKVYELYQPQIDHYYGIVESKVKQGADVAREQLDKIPFFKKKVQEKQE